MKRKLPPNNQSKKQKKEQEGRRSEPTEKLAKPRVDESKEKTAEEARRKDWDIDDVRKLDKLYLNGPVSF